MSQVLIREVKAHYDVITSLAKMSYDDCECLLSSSKDNFVKTWSKDIDLWGMLNQETDREDPLWYMPTKQR